MPANVKWHRTHRLTCICASCLTLSLCLYSCQWRSSFNAQPLCRLPLSWLLVRRNFSIHYQCNNKTQLNISWFGSVSFYHCIYLSSARCFLSSRENYSIRMWQSANKRSSLSTATMKSILQAKSVYATRTHYIKLIRIIKYETSFQTVSNSRKRNSDKQCLDQEGLTLCAIISNHWAK